MAQNCFSLKGSTTCPGMDSSMVVATSSYTNIETFDTFVKNAYYPTSSQYVTGFKEYFDCPNWNGHKERYHLSTICSFLVQKSGCTQPSDVKPLCKEMCLAYISSSQAIFANASACNQNPAPNVAQRRADSGIYGQFCNELPSNSTGTCVTGMSLEANQCGFINTVDATNACDSSLKNSTCCVTFAQAQMEAADKGLGPPNNSVWIISGIAAGILLLIIVFYIFYIRGKRWSKKTTDVNYSAKKRSVIQNIAKGARLSFSSSSSNPVVIETKSSQRSPIPAVPPLPKIEEPLPKPRDEVVIPIETDNLIRMKVIDAYAAGMDDEIPLNIGDIVLAQETFDDGWAIGKNVNNGKTGAFPLACCQVIELPEPVDDARSTVFKSRTSSLYSSYPLNIQ